MAVANLNFPRFRAFDSSGAPLNGGTVTVYEAGTTTKTTIWNDADKSATLSNPVTLDANGEAEIWFEGPVKVVLANSAGTQQWTIDDIQSDIPPSDVGRFNLLENGSFELDSTGDNQPDDWTITEDDATSTVEIDTTNVSHGANSLKFVSQGSGGGTATTADFFEVNAGKTCVVAFTIKSTVSDVRNQVQVRYFDKDQVFISADTVYDEDTSNPTSFEEKRFVSSVPATATYAKLRLIGCDPSDATSGTTYFDDVKVFTDQQAAVYSDGTSVVNADNIKNAITASTSGISFPNVNADVTATDEELNKLDGFTGDFTTMGYWALIEKKTASGQSELDFTTGIDSTHDRYKIVLINLELSTTDDLWLRTSTDTGTSFDSGATDYEWGLHSVGSNGADNLEASTGDTKINLDVSTSVHNGEILLVRGGGSAEPSIHAFLWRSVSFVEIFGKRDNTTAIDAFRLLTSSSATIDSGTVSLYGWVDGS